MGSTNGRDFERRVARVEFAAGAFVRVRVPVLGLATPRGRTLTDIDVLSIEFDSRLRDSFSIHECKWTSGESREPDRLFWLAGFKSYLKADRGVFVRRTVSRRGRELARRLGLETLESRVLESRERESAWLPSRFGETGLAWEAFEAESYDQIKRIGQIPSELVAFLRHSAPLAVPHRAVGAVATLASTISGIGVVPEAALQALASHSVVAILLAAIRVAGTLDSSNPEEQAQQLTTAWATGRPGDTQVIDVLRAADAFFSHQADAIHRAYVKEGAKRIPLKLALASDKILEAPPWLDRLLDLAERLRANPSVARALPQTVELACFEALVGGHAHLAPAFDHLFTPEHRQLLAQALLTLEAVAGETVARPVSPILDLPFDRSAAAVPDRRAPYDEPEGIATRGQQKLMTE